MYFPPITVVGLVASLVVLLPVSRALVQTPLLQVSEVSTTQQCIIDRATPVANNRYRTCSTRCHAYFPWKDEESPRASRFRWNRKYGNDKFLDRLDIQGPVDLNMMSYFKSEDKLGDIKYSTKWRGLSFLYPVLVFGSMYAAFPLFQMLPSLVMFDQADNSEVTTALVGAFLPAITVLFGTLASFTISSTVSQQNILAAEIAQELIDALKLTERIIALNFDSDKKSRLLENMFFYLLTVIGKSRRDELLLMQYRNPLLEMLRLLDREPTSSPLLERALSDLDDLIRRRQFRLTAEGESVPFLQSNLLYFLGFCVSVSFITLCNSPGFAEDIGSENELRFFFGLFFSGMAFTFQLIQDLNEPYTGIYRVGPSALSNVNSLNIRNAILREMGADWVATTRKSFDHTLEKMYAEVEKHNQIALAVHRYDSNQSVREQALESDKVDSVVDGLMVEHHTEMSKQALQVGDVARGPVEEQNK